jgi:competence protein ComGC
MLSGGPMLGLRILVVALFAALLPALSVAQSPVEGTHRTAIVEVIRAQMDAFRRDDGDTAFSYAAPSIRGLFQNPQTFMAMVRGGYAAVYRPSEVEFLDPRREGPDILQPVRVTGPDGESIIAIYRMQRQADGSWKIAGVVILRTGERSS